MRKTLLTTGLVALLLLPPAVAAEFTAKVIGVSDGDTITVLHDDRPEKLRLAEIDCPEKRQAFGRAAKQRTADLTYGKTVDVNVTGHDRYGRSIAEVNLPDGSNLNRELVAQGLAWCYRKYSHSADLLALEADAKNNHRGLWSAPDATPPWEFRHPRK